MQHGSNLGSLGALVDYLELDPQPIFVAHLAVPYKQSLPRNLHITFANSALTQRTYLHESIIRATQSEVAFATLVDVIEDALYRGRLTRTQVRLTNFSWDVKVVSQQWLVAKAILELRDDQNHHEQATQVAQPRTTAGSQKVGGLEAVPPLKIGRVHPNGHVGSMSWLEYVENFDWASTSLGPMSGWSRTLRQSFESILASPNPSALMWGDDYTIIYNEQYSTCLGSLHPSAFGRPVSENWGDEWPILEKSFKEIRETGQSQQVLNTMYMLPRGGYMEEDYFSYSWVPILSDSSTIEGLFIYVRETTRQIVSERRMLILTDVNDKLAAIKSTEQIWAPLTSALNTHRKDVHFGLIFTTDLDEAVSKDGTVKVELKGAVGLDGLDLSTVTRPDPGLLDHDLATSIRKAFRTGKTNVLTTEDGSLSTSILSFLQERGLSEPCREIAVQPLICDLDQRVAAVLVLGASPLRKYDSDYRSFVHLMSQQVEAALTMSRGVEKERALLKTTVELESERRFRVFAERAPVGIFMYDADGGMVFCNNEFEQVIGFKQSELRRPMAFIDTLHADCVDEVKEMWKRCLTSYETLSMDVQFKKPWVSLHAGSTESLDRTWGLAATYAERNEQGQLRGVVGVVTDISSQKWAEQMGEIRLAETLESKRAQENFLDMTSHEIRNPLNAISHCAYELVETLEPNTAKKQCPTSISNSAAIESCVDLAKTIMYCASHQKRIVDDVLTLSKLDARLLQIFPVATNPLKLARDVLDVFKSELRASDIGTEVQTTNAYLSLCIHKLLLDPHRVTQVMINLVSNAIKFMKAGPQRQLKLTIDASLTEPSDPHQALGVQYVKAGEDLEDPTDKNDWGIGELVYLSVSVQDTGPGMTPSEASVLFHRFSQARPRTHAQYGGSGLGLFISRQLAEKHGGRIGLSSEPGSGSLFNFYIKTRRDSESPMTTSSRKNSVIAASIAGTHRTLVTTPPMKTPPLRPSQPPSDIDASSSTITARRPSNLSLPVRFPLKYSADVTPDIPATYLNRPAHILVVEDNLINQRLLRKLLIKHNYLTSVANNGEEALALVAASAWNILASKEAHDHHSSVSMGTSPFSPTILDLVLCDIEMPVMDGKQFVGRIRSLQRNGVLSDAIPVVAVTGNAREEQVREAKECGFDDVVRKPYDIPSLLRLVKGYTETSSSTVTDP